MLELEHYTEKGEVVVIQGDQSFALRNITVREYLKDFPYIAIYSEEKVSIETVRAFVYELQKKHIDESIEKRFKVKKIALLICDDIALAAQHALLKEFENIESDTCILIYAHINTVLLSTIVSRVIVKKEKGIEEDDMRFCLANSSRFCKWSILGKSVSEKLDIVKKIIKDYEDELVTKQDVIQYVKHISKQKNSAYVVSMLKQPSVSLKYVLEYVVLCN
jgi:hypothetical protein